MLEIKDQKKKISARLCYFGSHVLGDHTHPQSSANTCPHLIRLSKIHPLTHLRKPQLVRFFEGERETETKALFFCIAFSHLFLNSLEIMQKGWDGSRTCCLSKEWNSASPSHEPSYEGAWREGESQRGLRPGCGSQPPATSHHSRQKLHFV